MHVFIIAAITADGKIAKRNDELADWTSKEDKDFFRARTKEAGVMVMGSTTFETIGKPLPGRRTIVLSRSKTYEGVEVTSESPKEIVERLTKEGVRELAICGGSRVYGMFMAAGVVTTLYLTLEPKVFGDGVPLFGEALDVQLSLKNVSKLNDASVLLEYAIIR